MRKNLHASSSSSLSSCGGGGVGGGGSASSSSGGKGKKTTSVVILDHDGVFGIFENKLTRLKSVLAGSGLAKSELDRKMREVIEVRLNYGNHLIEFLEKKVTSCKKVILTIGSNRQSKFLDDKLAKQNDNGKAAETILSVLSQLKETYRWAENIEFDSSLLSKCEKKDPFLGFYGKGDHLFHTDGKEEECVDSNLKKWQLKLKLAIAQRAIALYGEEDIEYTFLDDIAEFLTEIYSKTPDNFNCLWFDWQRAFDYVKESIHGPNTDKLRLISAFCAAKSPRELALLFVKPSDTAVSLFADRLELENMACRRQLCVQQAKSLASSTSASSSLSCGGGGGGGSTSSSSSSSSSCGGGGGGGDGSAPLPLSPQPALEKQQTNSDKRVSKRRIQPLAYEKVSHAGSSVNPAGGGDGINKSSAKKQKTSQSKGAGGGGGVSSAPSLFSSQSALEQQPGKSTEKRKWSPKVVVGSDVGSVNPAGGSGGINKPSGMELEISPHSNGVKVMA